jgi:hypothetical protein
VLCSKPSLFFATCRDSTPPDPATSPTSPSSRCASLALPSREEVCRDTEALGHFLTHSGAHRALACEDIGEGFHGDPGAAGQLGLAQAVLRHQMAKPFHGREFGIFVNRVFIVRDDQAEDIEVILLVGAERWAIEQAVDDLDRTPMLGITTDRAQGKRAEQCKVLQGKIASSS